VNKMMVQSRVQSALEWRMINEGNPLFSIVPDMMDYNDVPENEIIYYPAESLDDD